MCPIEKVTLYGWTFFVWRRNPKQRRKTNLPPSELGIEIQPAIPGSDGRMWSGISDFPWLRQVILRQNAPVWVSRRSCRDVGSHCRRFRQKPEANYENQTQIWGHALSSDVYLDFWASGSPDHIRPSYPSISYLLGHSFILVCRNIH